MKLLASHGSLELRQYRNLNSAVPSTVVVSILLEKPYVGSVACNQISANKVIFRINPNPHVQFVIEFVKNLFQKPIASCFVVVKIRFVRRKLQWYLLTIFLFILVLDFKDTLRYNCILLRIPSRSDKHKIFSTKIE